MWLADRHSDRELYTAAKHCAKIHLAQLHQTEEFLNLPLCLLLDILKGITGLLSYHYVAWCPKLCYHIYSKSCVVLVTLPLA